MVDAASLIKNLLAGIVPKEWTEIFELEEIKEREKEFNLVLIEKADLVPEEIQGKDWVLNGYCSPLEIMSFPLKGKATYVTIKKRKWKIRGESISYRNSYDLHLKGVKATKEFAIFLKELDREAADEFFLTWPHYRHLREEDISLV
jgi:hypothetical protein